MKKWYSELLSLSLLGTCAISLMFCSKPSKNEPEIVPQAEYQLRDMQYMMTQSDHIDTLNVDMGDTTIYNYSNVKVLSRFADNYSDLMKTSYFEVANSELLPTDLQLQEFMVHVPSQWNGDGSFTYFVTKVPISQDSLHVPYGKFWSDSVSVNIPARSKIVMDRSVQAQWMSCSFKAVVENKATGQTYDLSGTWKGILRYDNLTTRLTEHPLEEQ